MTEPKTPPLHPVPERGLKSPFMPENPTGTTPEPLEVDAAGEALRRQRGGAETSGGTRNKQ